MYVLIHFFQVFKINNKKLYCFEPDLTDSSVYEVGEGHSTLYNKIFMSVSALLFNISEMKRQVYLYIFQIFSLTQHHRVCLHQHH